MQPTTILQRISGNALVGILLLLVILLGGSYRFLSLNWDSSNGLHPDERYLTLNVLPRIGGALEFTPDEEHFPTQVLLVAAGSSYSDDRSVRNDEGARVGVLRGSGDVLAAEWIVEPERIERFGDVTTATQALVSGEVAALLMAQQDANQVSSSSSTVRIPTTYSSVQVQQMRCEARYGTGETGGYFDTFCSPYNPHNAGTGVFAYGTLPLLMSHIGVQIMESAKNTFDFVEYNPGGVIVWRWLSAFFDVGTIFMAFLLGRRMHNKWVGLLAAVLYMAAPLAIQKAHYGTVNSITNFFVTWALYHAVGVQDRGSLWEAAAFGFAFGCALAGRINVIPLAGMIIVAAGVYALPAFDGRLPWYEREKMFWRAVFAVFIAGFMTVLAFRVVNPSAFTGPTFLHVIPNARFIADAQQSSFNVSGESDIPPNYQWVNRTGYFYPLKDMVLWGLGIASGLMAWFGFLWAGWRIGRGGEFALRNVVPFVWVLVYFGWIGGLWVMTMRYYLPIYGSLVVLAAWAVYALIRHRYEWLTRLLLGIFAVILLLPMIAQVNLGGDITFTILAAGIVALVLLVLAVFPLPFQRGYAIAAFVVLFSMVWGQMFTNVYRHEPTRLQAARWAFENVPGDFAMRIDGAPEETPLINLAVFNANGNSAMEPEQLLPAASRYAAARFFTSEFTASASGPIDFFVAPVPTEPNNVLQAPQLYVTITDADGNTLLDESGVARRDLIFDPELGEAHQMTLAQPLTVEAGETYQVEYAAREPVLVEFVAPASGTVSEMMSPHLGDPNDDPEPEAVRITITHDAPDGPVTVADVTYRENFSRENHPLGDAHTIEFAEPFDVVMGERYSVRIEAVEGPFTSAGAVMVTESTWDDRLTTFGVCELPVGTTLADDVTPSDIDVRSCRRRSHAPALLQSYDIAMAYPEDNELKLNSILDGLEVGDYVSITSNRFYDSETRNPVRFPMTTRYYEALFNGELGFNLVGVFRESFEWGPLSVDDNHLPIYDSPDWLNELEADEAFHVYDHPVTFIFEKREDYDHNRTELILEGVPIQRQVIYDEGRTHEEAAEQIVEAAYWASIDADVAPTALQQPDDVREVNQAGGTWSDRFARNSILNTNQVVGTTVFWLTIIGIGWLMFPILFTVLPKLADRGYGFAKAAGLLVTGWTAWFLTSFKITLWSQGGLLLVLLGLAALSGLLAYRQRDALRDFIRERGRLLLTIEVLTLVLFLAWVAVRLTNPDLWHIAKGGEKPMDFAYFNATLRTTIFPAYDPWYSGGFINYYYLGYVITGVPVLLLKLVPSFAYNLVVPMVFALTGIGAFSLAFNIASAWKTWRYDPNAEDKRRQKPYGNPYVAGIAALLFCVVLGNLDTPRVLLVEGYARLGGYTQPQGLYYDLIERYLDDVEADDGAGLRADLTIATLPGNYDTIAGTGAEALLNDSKKIELRERAQQGRLSDEIRYEVGNVVELWTSVARGVRLQIEGQPLYIPHDRWYWAPSRILAETPGVGGQAITEMPAFTFIYADLHAHMIVLPYLLLAFLLVFHEVRYAEEDRRNWWAIGGALFLLGMNVGLFRGVNTWDWPTFMIFSTLGLGYAWWLRYRRFNRASVLYMLGSVGFFLIIAQGAIYPYTRYYASVYNSVSLWEGGKSPLWAYFHIHGLFLFLVVSLLVWDTGRYLRGTKVRDLRGKLYWVLGVVALVMIALMSGFVLGAIEYQVALIVIPLVIWIALLFFRKNQTVTMQYLLVMAAFALGLTLGVEVIVIDGDISRQNTVFKFYMEVWVAFAVVGGVALAWLFESMTYWKDRLRYSWAVPLAILVFAAAMFPITAIRARTYDRLAGAETPLTLDGLEYLQHVDQYRPIRVPSETITLANDWHIIRWLQDNVDGTPPIMEGRAPGVEYTWSGRIAINTGLPAVVGWNWHQRQQRTIDPLTRFVEQREANVNYFYDSTDIAAAVRMLRHYDVHYVVVSDYERAHYMPQGLAKFETMAALGWLDLAYERGTARVYRVNLDVLDRYALQARAFYDAIDLDPEAVVLAPRLNELDPQHRPDLDVNIDEALAALDAYEIDFIVIERLPSVQFHQPTAYDRLLRLIEENRLEVGESIGISTVYRVLPEEEASEDDNS